MFKENGNQLKQLEIKESIFFLQIYFKNCACGSNQLAVHYSRSRGSKQDVHTIEKHDQ